MKALLAVALAAVILGLSLYFGLRADAPPAAVDHTSCTSDLEALASELAELKERLASSERTARLEPERERASARPNVPAASPDVHDRSFDPSAWLEAYVRSFDDLEGDDEDPDFSDIGDISAGDFDFWRANFGVDFRW